jgi:Fe-S oxidoreductase
MTLEEYRGDMEMCCRCSLCKFVPMQRVKGYEHSEICPSIGRYKFHAYSGGGKLHMGRALLEEGVEFTDEHLDVIYDCHLCGGCDVSCKYGMDMEVLRPIQELRIAAVESGHARPAFQAAIERLAQSGSMVVAASGRGAWADGLGVRDATRERVDVLFHAGCLSSQDETMQGVATAAARVLQRGGVEIGIAGDDELCCGGRAYEMGHKDAFLDAARRCSESIRATGARTLVTACAECYYAFKVLYDRFDLGLDDVEVLHVTQLTERLIADGRLRPKPQERLHVTYHDPCHLGRLGEPWVHWHGEKIPGDKFMFDPPRPYRRGSQGVYEAPRAVIRSLPGVTLTEMDRIREYSWCSGACGGVPESNPELALWTARERLAEASSTGAQAIVTASPWSEKLLAQAAMADDLGLRVYDIVQLVDKATGDEVSES